MITRHCLAGYSAGKMCAFDARWMLACLGTVLKCEAKVWAWLAWIFFLWLKCGLLFCSVVFCDPPLLDMEGFVMFATTRFAFRRLIFMIIFVYCTVWNFHYIQPFCFVLIDQIVVYVSCWQFLCVGVTCLWEGISERVGMKVRVCGQFETVQVLMWSVCSVPLSVVTKILNVWMYELNELSIFS